MIDGKLKCAGCGEWLPATEYYYYNNKESKTGLDFYCKKCLGFSYGAKNRPCRLEVDQFGMKMCSGCKQYKHVDEDNFYVRKDRKSGWSSTCKDCYRKISKVYHQKNRENVNKRAYLCTKKRRNNDPIYRLYVYIGNSIRNYIKKGSNTKKCTRTSELLGCSREEYKTYFESLFTGNMSWDAFMRGEIEIDHIRPASSFNDLSDEKQQMECFNYKNTQPMWGLDNIRKGSWYNGEKHYFNKH